MKKVIIKSAESVKDKFPDREYFSVKFKGKTYGDAWEDKMKHIWFDNNYFEYVPPYSPGQQGVVYMHDFKQTGLSSWSASPKKSTARITIIR